VSRQSIRHGEQGISIIESMISIAILMVVCGTVMQGVLALTDTSRMVSNRTDMHSGVRNATELLTQEIGQAGRIALPGLVTLTAAAPMGSTSLAVTSTATDGDLVATSGMYVGQQLMIGVNELQETVVVSAVADTTITLTEAVAFDHAVDEPVVVLGGFAEGVIPPADSGYVNGSTESILKIFGDIHDDGRMVYVEYVCDVPNGRLYRNSMAWDAGAKVAPTVEEILIDNIEENPVNPDGTITPCFTYQTQTVVGRVFVVDVAVTLTIRSQNRDKNTGDFQRETKALLNVSPRNVFNVWQSASLGMNDRVQAIPPQITDLLPE
jgi:hypothetical protein